MIHDGQIVDLVREAIRKRSETPAVERIADMRRRGVIDAEGNVLLKMPCPRRMSARGQGFDPPCRDFQADW